MSDKQSTVFGQHSYGVSGVARRMAQVKPLVSSSQGRSTTGGGLPYHISYSDLLAGLTDDAVWFKSSHAQCDALAHNDSLADKCPLGKSSRAWIRPRHCGRLNQTERALGYPIELRAVGHGEFLCNTSRSYQVAKLSPAKITAPIGSDGHHL